jgi:hypothetical protein
LILTSEGLRRRQPALEFIDAKQRYCPLCGKTYAKPAGANGISFIQLRYELRKLVLLRQHFFLVANMEKQLWEVMLHRCLHLPPVQTRVGRDGGKFESTPDRAGLARLNFDALPFVQLMDVRAQKLDRKQLQVAGIVEQYLSAIETVAASVDTMQSSRQSI